MKNIVLLGAGYWGVNVIRNLKKFKGLNIFFVEPDHSKWSKIEDKSNLFPNLSELLEYVDVDAALVCTPVSTHYPLVKQLLNHGIHTLCQKPLVTSVKEAEELTTLAKEKNVKLATSFTYCFHPAIHRMSGLTDNGVLGNLLYYDSTRINLGIIQRDTNVLWDLLCHDAAILLHLTKKMPKFASCVGECHNKNGFADVANVSFGYENGFTAHVHVNWISPVKNRQIILAGNKKMVVFDDCGNEKLKIYDSGYAQNGDVFDYRTGDITIPKIENQEAVYLEIKHFLDCLENDTDPLTNGEFSIKVLKMIEAANKSMERCGEPVSL